MIKQKMSFMSPPISKVLLFLNEKIKELQDNISKPGQHLLGVGTNECFATFTHVYRFIIKDANSKININEMYNFLLTINRELVDILKFSNWSKDLENYNTKNSKLLDDTCRCSKGQCISSKCSRNCIKLCSEDYNIIRYDCKNNANLNVSDAKICDGNNDCSDGNDENKCVG